MFGDNVFCTILHINKKNGTLQYKQISVELVFCHDSIRQNLRILIQKLRVCNDDAAHLYLCLICNEQWSWTQKITQQGDLSLKL